VTDLSDTMIRFRADLEGAVARELARRRRRTRVVRPLAGAAVLAVAGGTLAATLLGGSGPSIVDRAEAALNTPGGQPLHMVLVGRSTTADGRVVTWRDEEWLVSGTVAPRRAVQTDAGGRRFETAMTSGPDRLVELYDPASNTIYAAPFELPQASGSGSKPGSENGALARRLLSPQERIKLLLAGGQLRDEGTVSVDGRDAVRLVTTGGDVTYLVDPDTYVPIELQAKLDDGGSVDLRFPVYEELPPAAVDGDLFSLQAQHPGATVRLDKLAYEQHWGELAPAKP
jgi:hypothetical protein